MAKKNTSNECTCGPNHFLVDPNQPFMDAYGDGYRLPIVAVMTRRAFTARPNVPHPRPAGAPMRAAAAAVARKPVEAPTDPSLPLPLFGLLDAFVRSGADINATVLDILGPRVVAHVLQSNAKDERKRRIAANKRAVIESGEEAKDIGQGSGDGGNSSDGGAEKSDSSSLLLDLVERLETLSQESVSGGSSLCKP